MENDDVREEKKMYALVTLIWEGSDKDLVVV